MKITDNAIAVVKETMMKAGLDLKKFCFHLYLQDDNLAMTFDEDIRGSRQLGDLLVKMDKKIEENPVTVDYVAGQGKHGLIFKEH